MITHLSNKSGTTSNFQNIHQIIKVSRTTPKVITIQVLSRSLIYLQQHGPQLHLGQVQHSRGLGHWLQGQPQFGEHTFAVNFSQPLRSLGQIP